MKKITKAIDLLLSSNYNDCKELILQNISSSSYELLMARKGLEKIYRNAIISNGQKEALIDLIKKKIPVQSQKIENAYKFLQLFIPISNRILKRIESQIIDNFPNSLMVFYYCLGMFVDENPNIIGSAKNIILSVAKKSLENDARNVNYHLSLSLDNIYFRNKACLKLIYQDAIKLGAITEKYDAISFGIEYVDKIEIVEGVPRVLMKFVDPDVEYGLQCGVAYHNRIVKGRYEEETGIIESFYKCLICKYCSFSGIDDSNKEFAFDLLKRQFANRNQTDLFFFFTGDYQSFVLSILTYIYTQFLLLFVCSSQTMKMVTKAEIREKMLWGDIISTEVFNDCYHLVITDDAFNKIFLVVNEDVVVGRWQFDIDVSIVELAKKISLNPKDSSAAGRNANDFGKRIYERLVKGFLGGNDWKTVPSSIKIKIGKQAQTDIDLLAYNQGMVIIGQIKFANSGRTRYDVWKAKQSINKAVEQVNLSMTKLAEDENLIYSILKKNNYCMNKQEIKKVVPVVITSSSYFIGEYTQTNIPIVSWDMFSQIIKSMKHYNTLMNIDGYFSDINSLYDWEISKEIVISEIDNEDFNIKYEEYE